MFPLPYPCCLGHKLAIISTGIIFNIYILCTHLGNRLLKADFVINPAFQAQEEHPATGIDGVADLLSKGLRPDGHGDPIPVYEFPDLAISIFAVPQEKGKIHASEVQGNDWFRISQGVDPFFLRHR